MQDAANEAYAQHEREATGLCTEGECLPAWSGIASREILGGDVVEELLELLHHIL